MRDQRIGWHAKVRSAGWPGFELGCRCSAHRERERERERERARLNKPRLLLCQLCCRFACPLHGSGQLLATACLEQLGSAAFQVLSLSLCCSKLSCHAVAVHLVMLAAWIWRQAARHLPAGLLVPCSPTRACRTVCLQIQRLKCCGRSASRTLNLAKQLSQHQLLRARSSCRTTSHHVTPC